MGDIHIIPNFQPQKTRPPPEEEEETLSLCDFQTTNSDKTNPSSTKFHDTKRRSSSEPSDFFEFFTAAVDGGAATMSHAEDIIFCGKLVPYYHQHHHHNNKTNQPLILKSLSADDASRKYSESPSPPPPDYYSNPTRPANRRRCRRRRHPFVNPDAADIRRSLSKSSAKSEGSAKVNSRPSKWPFVLMFGPLKLQPEMDLQDMKNRQTRRNVAGNVFFPAAESKGTAPARRRSSWGYDLLKVLSCKSHASVAVTASIGLVPHF